MTKRPKTCIVDLLQDGAATPNTIKGPIYVYYQLDNFYQNHRRYVKSRDNEQLFGKYKSSADLTNCDPIVNNSQLWPAQSYSIATKKAALGNVVLDPKKDQPGYPKLNGEDPAVPCGLVAKSLFNDTFKLCNANKGDCNTLTADNSVNIDETGIAWTSDLNYKFENLN